MAEKKNENMTGKSSFKSGDKVRPLSYKTQKMNNTKIARIISTRSVPINKEGAMDAAKLKIIIKNDVVNLVDIWGSKNIELSSPIVSQFDMAVMDAAYTIYNSGSDIFTAEDIVRVMSGSPKARVTAKKKDMVQKSVNRLRNIMIRIDYTEEYNKFYAKDEKDKAFRRVRESYLMPLDKDITIYAANGRKVVAYKYLIEPALYAYARFNGQLASVPKELMDTADYFADSEESVLIKRYVLRRVAQMSSSNNLNSNRISYLWYDRKAPEDDRERGLLPELGYKPEDYPNWRDKKMRINKIVKGTLQSLKDHGAIEDFKAYRGSKNDNQSEAVLGYEIKFSSQKTPLKIETQ